MEKERYVVMENFGRYIFHDTLCDKYYSALGKNNAQNLVTLLNQQDTKIKELESQVEKWKTDYENCSKLEKNLTKEHQYCLDNWRACEQENYQLKEENNFLEKRNEELTIDRRDFCLERNDLFEENQQLKQSQNQKAIEVLENVKNYFVEECTDGDGIETGDLIITKDIVDVVNYVDNQIKELRS